VAQSNLIGDKMRDIAIVGASSHIAKGLIIMALESGQTARLWLYARSPDKVKSFLVDMGHAEDDRCVVRGISELAGGADIIINCVGVGNPSGVVRIGAEIRRLTAEYDDLLLGILERHRETLLVALSSGVVYGRDFSCPATAQAEERIAADRLDPADHYAVAKAQSEARHRARPDLSIVDLRVFGYFSRWIDLNAGFLLTDVLAAAKSGTTLTTGPEDVVRDYAHPSDLYSMIGCCAARRPLNTVLDVYSAAPARKSEILGYFGGMYGLQWKTAAGKELTSPTGLKAHYYSLNRKAEGFGYNPKMTSLECIAAESRAILGR